MIENLKGNHEIVDYHGEFKIRIYRNKENENYPQHWHTDTEIIMPVENNYKVMINKVTYDLDVEDIMIIPPGELHEIYASPDGYRIIIQFDCTLFNSFNGFNSALNMFRPCLIVNKTTMPDIQKELSIIIMNITLEYFSDLPFKEAATFSMLTNFFTILGRNSFQSIEKFSILKNQKQRTYIDLIFNICNYINDHCTENLNMEDIADIAGFSKYHFARIFKQVMNISCYDYLINRRIMHAEKLLMDPDISIMQVAMKSGFSSLATFNRVFKTKKRCTPSEYKSLYEI